MLSSLTKVVSIAQTIIDRRGKAEGAIQQLQVNIEGLWTPRRVSLVIARAYHLQAKALIKLYDLHNTGKFDPDDGKRLEKTVDNLREAAELAPQNEDILADLNAAKRAYRAFTERQNVAL